FDFVMFLVERFGQIKDFVMSVYNSITAIASGNLSQAKQAVEDALSRSLPVVISLLASLAGLGGIGKTVKNIIGKVAKPVNKIVDKLIDRMVKLAKKLLKKGKGAAKKVKEKLFQWWKARKDFKDKSGKKHDLFFKGKGKSAEFMVASKIPKNLVKYLQINKDKLSSEPGYSRSLNLAQQIEQLSSQAAKIKNLEVKANKIKVKGLHDQIVEKMAKLSISMVGLMGLSSENFPKKPVSSFPPVSGGDLQSQQVQIRLLTSQNLIRGQKPKSSASPGAWKFLQNAGLTQSGLWVRMHIINEKLGGPGDNENLVPGPATVNAQMERYAEGPIKSIVGKGKNNQPGQSVIWVKGGISFVDKPNTNPNPKKGIGDKLKWGTSLTLKAGYYFHDGKDWKPNSKPAISKTFNIPIPEISGTDKKLHLNTASRNEILAMDFGKKGLKVGRKDFKKNLDRFYQLILKGKNFVSREDFEQKIADRWSQENQTPVPESLADLADDLEELKLL
ncbi:MAG: hypothetical protein AB4372_15020, partial [Xenococcus sp. (in: cyanobacteria)]